MVRLHLIGGIFHGQGPHGQDLCTKRCVAKRHGSWQVDSNLFAPLYKEVG